jgi:hypothetical protein
MSVCESFDSTCRVQMETTLKTFLDSFGGFLLPDCGNGLVGDEGSCYQFVDSGGICTGATFTGYDQLDRNYVGSLAYPEGAVTLNDGTSVQCYSPDNEFVFNCENLNCIEGTILGPKADDGSCATCIFPCPSPMYSDSQYQGMWQAYIAPSLIS